MDDFCKELEKVVKAGIGAVATGMEKAQEAVEHLARKGEPIFEQAKEKVTNAADKVAKAFSDIGKPKLESLLHDARSFTIEELKQLREGLDVLISNMEQAQQEADVILSTQDTEYENAPETME